MDAGSSSIRLPEVAQEAAGATSAEVGKAIADLGMPHLRHEVTESARAHSY